MTDRIPSSPLRRPVSPGGPWPRHGSATTTARSLPVVELAPPSQATPSGLESVEPHLAEFRPEDVALPSFVVWTLGCQMNRSDSEEMAGRLLAAGCRPAASLDTAGLIVINTCAIRETAEQKVIGRQGQLARLKEANPGLRIVMTGCSVREMDRGRLGRRYPAVDLFLRPDEEPELVDRLGLASAQGGVGRSVGLVASSTDGRGPVAVVNGTPVGVADALPSSRAAAVAAGAVERTSRTSAWLPIIYGCDKTCTYCIVPFSRGPERSRPFDEILAEARAVAAAGYREVTLLGQNVNSYGHDLPAEPRFAHVRRARTVGRRLDAVARPDLAELLRAIDALRTADGRPAIPRLRFVTSHPWDLSDRLVAAMAECSSVCEHLHLPVQSGDDAVLRRMGRQYTIAHYLERLETIRAAVPGITVSTDVIVGFCGETEAQFEATLELLERVRFDQVFAAAFSPRPGTPAARLPDDVPAIEKRRRLNALLALQEGIGLDRNRGWVGRDVEVLVDALVPRRSHAHDDERDDPVELAAPSGSRLAATAGREELSIGETEAGVTSPTVPTGTSEVVSLSGRSRGNKLVHLTGPVTLLGETVTVRIDHAGPYALRGRLV